jgi:hypothetical protein
MAKFMNDSIIELLSRLDQRTSAIWALDCASHVLPYFSKKYPRDNRPQEATRAGRAWVRGQMKVSEVRKAALAAHAAARDAKDGAAIAAARSAGQAASTAHVAGHAIHAAAYAIKAAGRKADKEQAWQRRTLLKLINNS